MKQAGTKKSLKQASTQANINGYAQVDVLYEGNFLTNAARKAKEFLKSGTSSIKKAGKEFIKKVKDGYKQSKSPKHFLPGKMIAFQYKAKDATQKFDKSPLVISLGYSQNPKLSKSHFIGLNIHWMPMNSRVALASFFTELNAKRKGKLTYNDVKPFLNKFKGHKILRMYIIKNVSNRVYEMPQDQFLGAAAVDSSNWSK